MRPAARTVLLPLVACLAVGGYPLACRLAFDRANDRIMVAVDLGELSDVCRGLGRDVQAEVSRLASMGVNAMVTTTYTLTDLADLGALEARPAGPTATRIWLEGPDDPYGVRRRLGQLAAVRAGGEELHVGMAGPPLESLRIFSSRPLEDHCRGLGLSLLRRIPNLPFAGPRYYTMAVGEVAADDWILFDGKEALGHPASLAAVSRLLASRRPRICQVEFAGQLGAREVSQAAGARTVLLHSVTTGEMARMPLARLMPRWSRAAAERGIRAFLVRFFPATNIPFSGLDLLEANMRYTGMVLETLRAGGYRPGTPLGPGDFWEASGGRVGPLVWVSRLAAGVALGWLVALLVTSTGLIPLSMAMAVAAPVPVAAVLGLVVAPTLAAQATALAIAIAAATLGPVLFVRRLERAGPGGAAPLAGVLLGGVVEVLAVALLGGLLVSMTLSEPAFVFRLQDFRGVKLVYALPPLLVVGLHLWSTRFNPLGLRLTGRHAALALAVVAAGAVYVLRSGNYVSVGSPFMAEYVLRDAVDEMGLVRPRTKEFLIGYPALMAAGLALARADLAWGPLLLLAGSVAPVSVVNSLCHIHTPPLLSVTRALVGLLPGLAIGALAVAAYLLFLAPTSRPFVCVTGYLGFGNLGDDLILGAFLRQLDRHLPPSLDVLVFTHRPRPPRGRVHEASRHSPVAIIWGLMRARALVSLGGGLFQDRTGPMTCLYYLSFVILARLLCGVRVIALCQSFSSLRRPLLCSAVARGLSGARLVLARDEPSVQNLRTWGLDPATPLEVSADLAIWDPPRVEPPAAMPAVVGVSLRRVPDTTGDGSLPAIVRAVARLARERRMEVRLLALQPDQDRSYLEALRTDMSGLDAPIVDVTVDGWPRIMGSLGLLVAMRYHAQLLGFMARVPTLVLIDDDKSRDLFEREGYPHTCSLATPEDELLAALVRLDDGRTEALRRAGEILVRLAERAEVGRKRLAEVLEELAHHQD